MNDLIAAIGEVIDLLETCEPVPKYLAAFRACKEKLTKNPSDQESLEELRILSAPRGFLGDGPLYPLKNTGMTQRQINSKRQRGTFTSTTAGADEQDEEETDYLYACSGKSRGYNPQHSDSKATRQMVAFLFYGT